MHRTLLLGLWALLALVIYRVAASLINSYRHAAAARQLGCQPSHRIGKNDPFGIMNIWNILQAGKEYRIPQYLQHRTECNKNITTTTHSSLGSTVHFTIDPKNIQAVLAVQFKDFGLGERRIGNFSPLLGHGIFSADGKEWESARALLRPQFARDQVSDLDLEENHVQNMMRVIPVSQDGWTDVIDLMPLFFRLTIDSATEFLFGESVDSQLAVLPNCVSSKAPMAINECDFAVSFDKAQSTIAKAIRVGASWLVFDQTFRQHCKLCHDFIDHYVQLALAKEKGSNLTLANGKQKYVFLDALVESTRNPVELRSHMMNILLAGRDTTASLLSYVFMLFTQHPKAYARLRQVILEEFGGYHNPRNLTFSSLKSCNYLQWVLNETLRLYPVVPSNGRRALKDTTIPTGGGPDGTAPVYIRKGEQVGYSVYVMHRRKDIWGADADEFNPDRWNGRKTGWEYLPFNGGPRICIGQQFALTEAGYVIVRLAQRFELIESVGNSWEAASLGGKGYVRHALSLTACPADGVKVRMKEATSIMASGLEKPYFTAA